MFPTRQTEQAFITKPSRSALVPAVLALLAALLAIPATRAAALPSGDSIVEKVNQVDEGTWVSRKLTMQMIDRRGKQRVRETVGYRKYLAKEKRTVLFYLRPANVKGTGFLTYDYPGPEQEDDQWLYLPALRKVRRISASDRGDYFLGTDFSYEDIKKEGKIEVGDYHFTTLADEPVGPWQTFRVEGLPRNDAIARELGYGRTEFWVDQRSWVIVKARYWDTRGNPLKTLVAGDIRRVDGIWTRHVLEVENHKTGHRTIFTFSEVDYQQPVEDALFSKRALARGR